MIRAQLQGQPKRRRSWFWPIGITAQLLLIMIISWVAAQVVTGVFHYLLDRNETEAATHAFGNRVISLVQLLEDLSPEQQTQLLVGVNDRLLDIQQVDQLPVMRERWFGKRQRAAQVQLLKTQLSRVLNADYTITIRDSRGSILEALNRSRQDPGLWPSGEQVVVAIANPAGGWWVFTTPYDWQIQRPGSKLLSWVLISGLILWLFLAGAARRVTAPILAFAAAADRLGMDMNAPPLPERGSAELRQMAQAFNQMQTRLQRLIADRTLMLAAISHDLRTVLTRLRLRTEFIEDDTQRHKAETDVAQMEAMLNTTMVFAKEDSTPEARTQLDLASLLQSICDDLVDAGAVAEYQGGDRISIEGQSMALRRAFTNLITNATIYGQAATVLTQPSATGVDVLICDRGPGIPEHQREKVFQPFFRLEPSRNRETGGTGLGLSVARTVIRRHGGEIKLGDRDGGGLIVTVTLP